MMQRLTRLLRLSLREWAMLAEAVLILAWCCLALRVIPYRRLMRHLPAASDHIAPVSLAREIAVALRRAAKMFDDGLCLREALTGHIMFARRGHAASIRLGMKQDDDGVVSAHAWLVSGSHIITGGTSAELDGFAEFVSVGSRSA